MAKNKNSEVKKKARRVVDLGRLPEGTLTVDDVIATNDINALLAEVQSKRADIDALLVAWRNPNGTISYRYVKATDTTVVAICEIVKQHCIQRSWLSGE
jgi:hypothetical protein